MFMVINLADLLPVDCNREITFHDGLILEQVVHCKLQSWEKLMRVFTDLLKEDRITDQRSGVKHN